MAFLTIYINSVGRRNFQYIVDSYLWLSAILSLDNLNVAVFLNHSVQSSRTTIKIKLGHGTHGARNEFIFPIHGEHNTQARTAVHFFQLNTRI